MKISAKYVLTSIASIILTLSAIIVAVSLVKNNDKNPDKHKNDNKTQIKRSDNSTMRNVSLKYGGKVHVDISNKKVKFYFSNPEQSNRDVKFDIVLINGEEEILIASNTNLLGHGEVIENLDYIGPSNLEKGQYNGKFKVKFYNSKGIEEVLNSVINIFVIIE